MKNIIQLFLSVFLIFMMSGCLPFQKELEVMLNQHNLTQKIYIKNDTNGYDNYNENKKVLQELLRGEEYEIIDVKNGYVRVERSKNNILKKDVWVSIDDLEIQPTYFITLIVNAPNPNITLAGEKYESTVRLPNGNYEVSISANDFLDKHLEIELSKDTVINIDLGFDEEKEKKRLEEIRLQKEQIETKRIEKEKRVKELKQNTYIDKKQKLMWQDNKAVVEVQKTWITKENYELKNYNNTSGDTATTYCKKLILVGFRDWRLPTKEELKNLYMQKSSLKNSSPNWYWSSSYSENIVDRAWGIYFNNGDGFSDQKNTSNYVRCVRGNK